MKWFIKKFSRWLFLISAVIGIFVVLRYIQPEQSVLFNEAAGSELDQAHIVSGPSYRN